MWDFLRAVLFKEGALSRITPFDTDHGSQHDVQCLFHCFPCVFVVFVFPSLSSCIIYVTCIPSSLILVSHFLLLEIKSFMQLCLVFEYFRVLSKYRLFMDIIKDPFNALFINLNIG